jgi:nanoRNase/pAp phosphatase (c-di-AMP/oligoRNAs hydrolase)
MEILNYLREALDGCTDLLIIPHNDPDPDAIAAAIGLRYLVKEMLGIEGRIRYQGIIGRAENKALVRYLNQPLKRLNHKEMRPDTFIALVDTQPGSGNNPVPDSIRVSIVIDHHLWRDTSSQVKFVDVRPEIGASATIITEYLQAAEIVIPPYLATALFYGIQTDTMGLGRGASVEDTSAYFYLQPKIDVKALVEIERAQVPVSYFNSLNTALEATRIFDDLVVSYLGNMRYPDLGAEIADLLWRLRGTKWVICMGVYENEMILSVRSRSQRIGAGNLVRQIVGELGTSGGHGTMAGGQIQLFQQDPIQLSEQLTQIALQYLKENTSLVGKPLI